MGNIKSVKSVGRHQTYDLEVDHPDHQYYLSNGMLSSNSHATLYSMISFFTAWLKSHYPLPFLTALLESEVNSNVKAAKDNILKIKTELRGKKVKIIPPDVNVSDLSWKIINDKTLMTGLDSLKYMGKDAIPELITKRPFTSFKDLIYRTTATKVRATAIQAMAASGSLDSFGMDRKLMFLYASDYRAKLRNHMSKLERLWKKENFGKQEVFTDDNGVFVIRDNERVYLPPTPEDRVQEHFETFNYPFPEEEPWSIQELFALEEFYLGEGISGDAFERYPGFFDKKKTVPFSALIQMFPWEHHHDDERLNRKSNTHYLGNYKIRPIEGIIVGMFVFTVKKEESPIFGQEMARLTLQDPWGDEACLICFPEAWEGMKHRIEKELSRGNQKITTGVAIRFLGLFQWETENSVSFVLNDILDFKSPPALPADRSSRKVKMPREKKVTSKDVKTMSKEDLFVELEDEALDDGVSDLGEEY